MLRMVLTVMAAVILSYTGVTIARHGLGLVPIFFGDIAGMTWRGQFNLDFLTYLILSALWVAWRHGFSGGGIVLAALASVLGMSFLAPYLLVVLARCDGDLRRVLLGVHADDAGRAA